MKQQKQERIAAAILEHTALIEETFRVHSKSLTDFSERVVETFHQGGRLLVLGNGSLGAISSLISNLFLHRLSLERPLLPAISLSHDATLATGLARAGQASQLFARQLRAIAAAGDVVLALGDAQRDEAVEEALTAGRQLGCTTAVLVQGKSALAETDADFLFRLETDSASRAMEGTLLFGHLLCELVEGELFGV